ncbi:MAG: molecular chaperone HtpG [Bacteroidetes bacterium]|nr:molecular chaperone HtpG [Bacteroidota bacterium]MDA1336754.1 molecular chaperone HtpG [Bacteroidota bacterium]
MAKGNINVQTENIFPIIKKFLYSDHEIFLRELVSNAVDATQKRLTLAKLGEIPTVEGNTAIEVIRDQEAKTLTIRDRGIGMSEEEVNKYINQIAFSGATEFLDKYQGEEAKTAIIGHFGLGFYSAFMVAKQVDIVTWSQRDGETAIKWSCDGSPEYSIDPVEKEERGTDIILHIADDSEEFLEDARIQGILTKYCKFMPVEIIHGTKTEWIDDPNGEKDDDGKVKKIENEIPRVINSTTPLWSRTPADLKDEDYSEFYKELYPMNFEDPLFHIHLNVDFPFNLTGILYFPQLKKEMELRRDKIHLYSNQVFITDNVENIVPDFLTLLHGVIDSPDIPLNVSRSYLQEDANVKKISGHISKKVSDKLNSMFKKDRNSFAEQWDDLRIFIEYGMLTDEKFLDRAKKFMLFKDTTGECTTYEELIDAVGSTQKDKNGKIILPYTADAKNQHAFIAPALERGYKVLVMEGPLAAHMVQKLEEAYPDVQFKRVDSDVIDKLIETDEATTSALDEKQEAQIKPIIEGAFPSDSFKVNFVAMAPTAAPLTITRSEFMRRMKEQQAVGGGGFQMFGSLPDSFDVAVNSNHALIQKILGEKDEKKQKSMAKKAGDLARLSQGLLEGEELTTFIQEGYAELS